MNKALRELFPGTRDQVYLDVAARGLVPEPVKKAILEYLDECVLGTGDKDLLRQRVDEARAAMATLIGADQDEVAITKNVSEGLNLFAASLPWDSGDNVVLCPQLEHPNNIYLWYNLARRQGIEVRDIPPDSGRMPVTAMVEAMDERTRVVTCPSVSFAPGFITDVPALIKGAQNVGALTLVDAAQSIGALQTDVRTLGVDALTVATQKCLLSMYGFGFLYIRREVAEQLVPVHVARYGIDLGEAHETAFTDGDLSYLPGARRFDLGNYNYLGATAARAALAFIAEIGMENVEHHVRGLGKSLASGLFELGLPIAGGALGSDLAHIVSVGESGGGRHYTTEDEAMNKLYAYLTEHKIKFSIRSGALRFSIGVYNDQADIDQVIEVARKWCDTTGYVR